MNKAILQPKVQDFIRTFQGDPLQLSFSKSPFEDSTSKELIQQIQGLNKSKKKLPNWYRTKGIYFPPKINLEQTSSEITAAYKAKLLSGKTLVDLTGGLGIDSYYFANYFTQVTHVETNSALSEIATHNFSVLGANTITCVAEDGIKHIQKHTYDVIYLDPARRDNRNKKVYHLEDCTPNVLEYVSLFLNQATYTLLKTAPLLDISLGIRQLKQVKEVHIVAVQNEVKELVWVLSKNVSNNPKIIAVNLLDEEIDRFQFTYGEREIPTYGNLQSYLYEPNAALMKSGAFGKISKQYNVHKLAPNSHLFTSDTSIDFPGRSFKIEAIHPYSKKVISKFSKQQANITTRNFPETVTQIRKKFKILEGGQVYLFFTTLKNDKKVVIETTKIENKKS